MKTFIEILLLLAIATFSNISGYCDARDENVVQTFFAVLAVCSALVLGYLYYIHKQRPSNETLRDANTHIDLLAQLQQDNARLLEQNQKFEEMVKSLSRLLKDAEEENQYQHYELQRYRNLLQHHGHLVVNYDDEGVQLANKPEQQNNSQGSNS